MSSRWQYIIITPISIFIAIFLFEMTVRLFDPLGWMQLRAGNIMLLSHIELRPLGEGYTTPSGRYRLTTGQQLVTDDGTYQAGNQQLFTILGNGSRLVIESNPNSECVLTAIGDSITFGSGVDDADTWANLWAADNDYTIVNAGHPALNATEVAATMERYPSDGYVWLLFDNDDVALSEQQPLDSVPFTLASQLYIRTISNQSPPVFDVPAFVEATQTIADRGALIFTFEDNRLLAEIPEIDVITIPRYTTRISPVDGHPDAEGHQHIYTEMQDVLATFADTTCDDSE